MIHTALVLTAGLGTRLRPLSYDRAKAAVPVAGEALVRRILKWLAAQNVRDLVLNLHFRPQTIAAEVGDGEDLGVRVRYSWEHPVLGSAGGPRKALPLLDSDPFFVINGDTLTDLDLSQIVRAHRSSGALVTMAVVPSHDPSRYGGVVVDADGTVSGFTGRGSRTRSFHFIGVQVTAAEAFVPLAVDQPVETVGQLYPELIRTRPGSVRAFVSAARFHDVGTPADYLETSLAIAREEGMASPPSGRRTRVHPTAIIRDCVLWDDVEVEAACRLTRCVLGDGVRVPAGSRFEERALVRARDYRPGPDEEIIGELLVARF